MMITGTVAIVNPDRTFVLVMDTRREVTCKEIAGRKLPWLTVGQKVVLQGDYLGEMIPKQLSELFSFTSIAVLE